MEFSEYQKLADKTAIYPNKGNNLNYTVLGIGGESGEILEKWKKILRDRNGILDQKAKLLFTKEIGDVLWYLAQTCTELQVDFGEVAQLNINKLNKRKKFNMINGCGDEREERII